MRSRLRLMAVCLVLAGASFQAQSGLPPGTWHIVDAPAETREYISRADLLILTMRDALQRELVGALAQGGPSFAIQSCHIDVEGVIHRVRRQEGVSAGRTSHRLRNQANAPTAWAAPLVAANAGRRASDVDGFAVDLGDAVGVLRPIAHRALCDSCHGSVPELDPAVLTTLKQRYPADRATGFIEGEIRGWFWVEVPKRLRD
jgi:hypothetical protein